MEESNQFLEENAIIYDTKNDNEETAEDIAYVYSGDALDMQDVFQFSCIEDIEPVIVAGEQESGKTTLEVMMYRLFLEGENERFKFAGSRTMKGFRTRSENLLKKSGSEKPNVPRTLRGEKKFLHLAVCGEDGKRKNLIFADYAGELFDEPSCLDELGEFFSDATNVLITLDGKKLCSYNDRAKVFSHAKILLIQMEKSGIISKSTHLYIVCTKFDEIKKAEKKEVTMNFLEEKYENLKKTYEMKVKKMELICLCAYGINEEAEKKKMEGLIFEFTRKKEGNCQSLPEKQIVVKRQMDKFRARG